MVKLIKIISLSLFLSMLSEVSILAQRNATDGLIWGAVRVSPAGTAGRGAVVTLVELKKSTVADGSGQYEFDSVPTGTYQLIAHLDKVGDVLKSVEVRADQIAVVDFDLSLSIASEQVTVTASGSSEAVSSAYQSVNSISSVELMKKNSVSIGEALDGQLGVAKRSFGPGSGRPVIRGFDGDRILVLEDGLRLGGIASQSADEVEPVDVVSLDRIEIVKGPATLLYGSNAIGGVVNGISTNDIYQPGLSGYATSFGGTNNAQAGAGAGFKYGFKNFLVFGNAGAQRTRDYRTPVRPVLNSYARGGNVSGGLGWCPRRGWLSFAYSYDRRRHGIPVEPDEVDVEYLKERRHSFEVKGGLREINSLVASGDFAFRYNDYRVREFEFESDENVTELDSTAANRNFNYRATLNQKRRGRLSGSFGVSGFTRDFLSVGEEAPAPHTKQDSFAAFALERFDLERIGFQFGGRIEQNGYNPEGSFRDRNFVGFSGSAGVRLSLWTGASFVANYQHSFRAPALEELYNNGPHPGILTFDIGNQNLNAEQGDAVDLSLRHNTKRLRLESSAYAYNIRNFVFTAFTGQNDPASNLPIIRYEQGKTRFLGTEESIEAQLIGDLWIDGKLDHVRAELIDLKKSLPRIPPLRGSIAVEWRHKAFTLRPELMMANRQTRVFDHETTTAGYAVFNLNASYSFVTGRIAQLIAINGYNLGDTLYRNHLSFITQIAPEIGRNVRLSYTLRF